MSVDERSRHALYQRFEHVLGREEATTLMEHLPPVGWADVATTRDLDAHAMATKRDLAALAQSNRLEHERLGETSRLEHESLEHKLESRFHAELIAQTLTFLLAVLGAVISVGGLAVAAARGSNRRPERRREPPSVAPRARSRTRAAAGS
jgi:hypothetical protein